MSTLSEAFQEDSSRVWKTVVVVDLSNSTAMKESQEEANWLTTYAWFFSKIEDTIRDYGGAVVKYLGDGAMAVFGDDRVADAINWVMKLQEEMADGRAGSGAGSGRVRCSCSVGIASGELIQFDSPNGAKDYIGTVVDRAFRLCGVANANAVFIDKDTVSAAAMNRLTSRAGRAVAPRRTAAEYQGKEEFATLDGISSPVAYHEILWENSRFSVKPKVASKWSSEARESSPAPSSPAAAGPWLKGAVASSGPKFGFIKAVTGEETFYFDQRCLFAEDIKLFTGDIVWFLSTDNPGHNHKKAIHILPVRYRVSGVLSRANPKGFGFAAIESRDRQLLSVFVNLGFSGTFKDGDRITFITGENKNGLAGFEPQIVNG